MIMKSNLEAVRETICEGVKLIAVSKYHSQELIKEAYDAGQRAFGESREQELKLKHEALPDDIEWHFIGHLQTNKVKAIVPYISMIQTVDSPRLIVEIEKQAARIGRQIDILLELHLAQEDTKTGMTLEACREFLASGEWRTMRHVRICGIMAMASNTDDESLIRKEFTQASDFFGEIKSRYFLDAPYFKERSFGMSSDYRIAMQCGSTMVRIGTAIFGDRNYT